MKVVIIVVERHPADHLSGPFLVYCSKLENNTNFEKEKSVIEELQKKTSKKCQKVGDLLYFLKLFHVQTAIHVLMT